MLTKIKIILLIPVIFFLNVIRSQSISLSGEIFEYATYYISGFDFSTGGTNVQIFRYELSSDQYPIVVKVRFTSSMLSPALGIDNNQTIISIETNPFQILAPVILDNRDISSETTTIFDQDIPPNSIELGGNVIDFLDPLQADAIMQSIFATGRISDGIYRFVLEILHGDSAQQLAYDERTINVETPGSINLESPGGALSDTLNNLVYTC